MDKLELENNVFLSCEQYLRTLYGDFDRIDEQTDRPDAAIRLRQGGEEDSVAIGIEITCVDKQTDLQYFNDEKFSRQILKKQIEDCIDGKIPHQPMKKSSIPMEKEYLYEAIENKRKKHSSYAAADVFDELIILVFSDFIDIDDKVFRNYLMPWTNYLLSNSAFPFDKVIFVDIPKSKCVTLYDVNNPRLKSPQIDKNLELGFTHIQSGFIPFDKTINLYDIFKQEPLVNKKAKKRKKK